ncbi:hypothetical protein SynA1825c_00101 [Synechococcus sp. A18-25c]|uniref:hypothetical protein n=1 Tax=Synechococcus sp. A18-25c TaxID=1866938 RepID=UPI001647B6A7|nr:hypothetical protein [Synechococcus sp. A18-25c]QNJ18444.1 hypothetical protein SynA1825c_00101 [Synechococcus sp. A18-25c]
MRENLENHQNNAYLEKNQRIAQASMGARYEALDWKVIKSRRDACKRVYDEEPFNLKSDDFLLLPPIMPANNDIAQHYASLNKDLKIGQKH